MEYFTKYEKELVERNQIIVETGQYLEKFTFDNVTILQTLYLSDNGIIPNKVLRELSGMKCYQLTRATQSLIKAGIVYSETDPDDHREIILKLTNLGKKLQKSYLKVMFPTKQGGSKNEY